MLALSALLSVLLAPAIGSASVPGESPRGQVLVVDANLLEAFGGADVADAADMNNFVRRLVAQLPYAPDALLLQEVVGPSAENVARFMSAATGLEYDVALATYPSPSNRQVEVIGGDFNNRPCVERDVAASDPGCTPMPFGRC